MKEEERGVVVANDEEQEKEKAKSTRKRSNARQKGREREKEGTKGSSTCDSSLHGLYFASWYLYLNSDGVTYEGGTRNEKRDRAKERRGGSQAKEKAGEREGGGRRATGSERVPCVVSELTP